MKALIERYRTAWTALFAERSAVFPRGTKVMVDCAQYRGTGTVAIAEGCPVDRLPVLLGNGNIWWYPLEDCEPAKVKEGEK